MIRLDKGSKPSILEQWEERWRDEYLEWLAGTSGVPAAAQFRYKNPAVKDALRVETHDKCAYCESRMLHVTPDHIEHIRPRAHHPDLVVTWTNLTIACPVCNGNKRDYDSDDEPLLNPYLQDPGEHLLFVGPIVLERPGSDLGYRTIRVLGLSRAALIEERTDRIRKLHPLLDAWAKEERPERKAMLERQVQEQVSDEAEFAATMRSFLLQVGFP